LLYIFRVALRPNVGNGLFILEVSISSQPRTTVGRTPLDVFAVYRLPGMRQHISLDILTEVNTC